MRIDRCQGHVLYLLYIEIVIVLVQHVIIVILSVLSIFLVVSGPWEGRVPGRGEQPGNSNAEVDGCHIVGADVLSADKPGFPRGMHDSFHEGRNLVVP